MEDGIPGGLQHRHKTCCEKGGCRGRRAYRVQRWHHRGDVVFRTGELAYDKKAKPLLPYEPCCSLQTLLMPATPANSFVYDLQRTSSTVPTLGLFIWSAYLFVGKMLLTSLFLFPASLSATYFLVTSLPLPSSSLLLP